jgi:hypothetical protein
MCSVARRCRMVSVQIPPKARAFLLLFAVKVRSLSECAKMTGGQPLMRSLESISTIVLHS